MHSFPLEAFLVQFQIVIGSDQMVAPTGDLVKLPKVTLDKADCTCYLNLFFGILLHINTA
jgi:hypothetical protein